MCVCVCVCARVDECVCVCVCMCVPGVSASSWLLSPAVTGLLTVWSGVLVVLMFRMENR